jgi:hypothetical protein
MRTGGWALLDEPEAMRGPIDIFKRDLQKLHT